MITGATLSFLGDGLRLTAIPLLAVTLTSDPVLVAGLLVAERLPWLVVAPFAADLADRTDRMRMAAIVQFLRVVVSAAFALAVSLSLADVAMLYAFVFVLTAFETAYASALYAVIPQVVPDEALERANGRMQAAQTIAVQFGGPPLAAWLFRLAPPLAFWIDAASFALSGAVLLRRGRAERGTRLTVTRQRSNWRLGLRLVARHAALREMCLVLAILMLTTSATEAVLVLFALETLGLSEIGYGLLFVGMGVGGVLGGLAAGRLTSVFGTRAVWVTATLVTSLTFLATPLAGNGVTVGLLMTVQGLAIIIANVASISSRQRLAPQHVMARVSAVFRIVGTLSMSVGAVMGGVLASVWGMTTPFYFAGAGCLAATLLLFMRFPTWRGEPIAADPLVAAARPS